MIKNQQPFTTKKGFTLLEIIIGIILLSVGLTGVFAILEYGVTFMERTRQEIIAINLAREGMEIVTNIRDSNRRRRAGKKDQCWLKNFPLTDNNGNITQDNCEVDNRITSGMYIITGLTINGQQHFGIQKTTTILNLSDGITDDDRQYTLCIRNGLRKQCPFNQGITREGRFFRQIHVHGLFDKNTNEELICVNGQTPECGGSNAKELRFCSIVEYAGRTLGKVELCGILTNYAP